MGIDLTKYEGHSPEKWVMFDLRDARNVGMEPKEEIVISIRRDQWMAIARIRNEVSGRPLTAEDRANGQLIADAPALLAEVVRLREELEFQRGVVDGARQNAAEKLAEADQLRADLAEAIDALSSIVTGEATCAGDAVMFVMGDTTLGNMRAVADARAVLAKHGGGK